MGSSLRVTPAADMPKSTAENGGQLVIVNLQKTPLDSYASLIIHAKCDDVMRILMEKLCYQIPEWKMKKRMQLKMKAGIISCTGVDSNGSPYELFKQITV